MRSMAGVTFGYQPRLYREDAPHPDPLPVRTGRGSAPRSRQPPQCQTTIFYDDHLCIYIVVGLIYFAFCFAMSRYSQRLEVELNRSTRH